MEKLSKKAQLFNILESMGNHPIRRTDIVRIYKTQIQHEDWNPIRDRGYISSCFCKTARYLIPWFRVPSKKDPRYLAQILNPESPYHRKYVILTLPPNTKFYSRMSTIKDF